MFCLNVPNSQFFSDGSGCSSASLVATSVQGWPEPYIYGVHTVFLCFFWQGNRYIDGHIRCIYAGLANPTSAKRETYVGGDNCSPHHFRKRTRNESQMCRDGSYVGLAKTVYFHRILPYNWWYPCQKCRVYTVYIWFRSTLLTRTSKEKGQACAISLYTDILQCLFEWVGVCVRACACARLHIVVQVTRRVRVRACACARLHIVVQITRGVHVHVRGCTLWFK